MSLDGQVWQTGPGMTYLTASEDGKLILATNSKENKVYLIDITQNKIVTSIETGKMPKGVKFSPDGEIALIKIEK